MVGFRGAGRLFVATILIVVAMVLVHEAGHAIAAKLLGYDVLANINSVSVVGGSDSAAHRMIIDAAGPLVTLAIAVMAWLAAERGRWAHAGTILFAALTMRVIAAAVSVFNLNDEARISVALGLGPWVVFAVHIAVLLAMFVRVYRRRRLGWRWLLVSYIAASLAFAALVFGERVLPAVGF